MVGPGATAGEGVHPGPESVRLPRAMAEAIVAQARAEYPNEACGIVIGGGVAAEGGEPIRYVPCRNEAASPYRYVIDSQEALRLSIEADDAGQEFWAIVHSHVSSEPRPSRTDVERIGLWRDRPYVIYSVRLDELAAWRIGDDGVVSIPLARDAHPA